MRDRYSPVTVAVMKGWLPLRVGFDRDRIAVPPRVIHGNRRGEDIRARLVRQAQRALNLIAQDRRLRVQLRWIIHVLPLAAAASPEVFATGRDAMRGRLQNVHEIGAREVLPSLRDACRDQFIGYRALDKDDQLTDAPDGRATIRHARDAKVHFGTDRWHCGR